MKSISLAVAVFIFGVVWQLSADFAVRWSLETAPLPSCKLSGQLIAR